MKVLLIHNYYVLKGGEDAVFEQEFELLKEASTVQKIAFKNQSGIKGAFQFICSIWNLRAKNTISKVIESFKPDIIHIHNWHFATGPIVIRIAKKYNIPVILTLHNYRLLCPSATLFVKNGLFIDSLYQSFPWKAIVNKVYRGSVFLTFWLAFIIWFHKRIGTWHSVNRFIVLTDFARDLYLKSNFSIGNNKITVKQNFVKSFDINKPNRSKQFLFVGRLSEEKGIQLILEAFTHLKLEINIAGTGPLLNEVIMAASSNSNIRYLGSLSNSEVRVAMSECSALIFPSIWYEGMPMTILEAFSLGTPVIASNFGAMASMIQNGYNGLHFDHLNIRDFKEKLMQWSNLENQYKDQFMINAINTYKEKYTPEANLKILLTIYNDLNKCDA